MNAWTEETKARLIALRSQGVKVPRIAAELGFPVAGTYAMAAKLCKVQEKQPLDDEARETISRLFAEGRSAEDIAARSGRSVASVRWALERLGLKRGRTVTWTPSDDEALRDVLRNGGGADEALAFLSGRLRTSVESRLRFLAEADEAAARPSRRPVLAERVDPRLAEAVRANFADRVAGRDDGVAVDHVAVRRSAEDIAAEFGAPAGRVRRVAESLGRSFTPAWSAAQHAFLLEACARFATSADVARFVGPKVGKRFEAVRSRIKALGIEVVGGETFERPQVRRRPIRPCPSPRRPTSVAPVPVPTRSAPAPAFGPAPARRQAAPAPSKADLDAMVASFLARREVSRPVETRGEALVKALRVRGYVVLGDGAAGFSVNGRPVTDVDALEAFAAGRGVRTTWQERAI